MKHFDSYSVVDEKKGEKPHAGRLLKIGVTVLSLVKNNNKLTYEQAPLDLDVTNRILSIKNNLLKYQSQI